MAVNPMEMMKMAERFRKFQAAHPKVVEFFRSLKGDVREGAVIEMSFTSPEGVKKTTNMRVNADDVETIQTLLSLKK